MLQSSAKRRRLNSPDPQAEINAILTGNKTQPTTPTRASYLSPTKSSLARSHPHLINRSISQPPTESRGKSLRDEILKGKTDASKTTEPDEIVNLIVTNTAPNQPDKNQNGASSDDAEGDFVAADITALQSALRSPSRERQTWQTTRPSFRALSEDPLPQLIKPTLVQKSTTVTRPTSRPGSKEPELPPTPVQLGLNTVPDRPRGLASSSSPRGSRMGSGKQRRRTRSDGPVNSSPLKPKGRVPTPQEPEALESEHELFDEAPESQIGESQVMEAETPVNEAQEEEDEDFTPQLEEKQATAHSLQRTLQALKTEIKQLERAIENEDLSDDLLSLLFPLSADEITPRTNARMGVDECGKTLAHLTLFAPGNLDLRSSTGTKKIKKRTKIIHSLTVTAPPPWPLRAFLFNFEVIVDAEHVQVEKIQPRSKAGRLSKTQAQVQSTGIYKWVRNRLGSPHHHLDMGGLIWGLGQWFSACVERAKVFRELDYRHNKFAEFKAVYQKDNDGLTEIEAAALAQYLNEVQFQLAISKQDNKMKKGILLIWGIDIDWTSNVRSNIDVAVTGVSAKTGQGLKEVFSSLIPAKGVVTAVESILGLMRDDHEQQEIGAASGQKGKRKRTS